ncbi:MAG: chromate resistance protein ChrB domain-containing protein [Candidatus Cybelea sp.]
MKFVTRVNARVDRIACPWLVRRFIDPHAEFLFVQPEDVVRVAEATGAKPFDVPGVELGHRGPECSFDAFIRSYDLSDPALLELARIVRGADTLDRSLTPESAGLFAIASGYRALSPGTYPDDHALLDAEFPIYDALYAYCQGRRA